MENALTSMFSLVFFIFAFGINIIVITIRTIIETILKKINLVIPQKIGNIIKDIWNEFILPYIPVVIGGLVAYYIKDYPYPSEFATSISGRVFFGLIAGFFSASVYRVSKFYIKKYVPTEIEKKVTEIAKQVNVNDEIPEPQEPKNLV